LNGIYAIELSEDGLRLKEGAEKVQVAGDIYEGTMIYKRGRSYYMFASIGTCCEGVTSTYQLVVGRSDSLLGPYRDKSGKSMMDNGFSLVINRNERFSGTGHCSEVVQDDAGDDWLLYHAYDNTDPNGGRKLMLDKIRWDRQGWPFVKSGSASVTADRPVFKN
jgi:arabinan endo-1,5-alpha-L-arabinosidase